ncbi:MAG: exodeoxyribonuclease III [Akkermansiaceae bacterium]|nr:exodeoxyribonuclease III [Akkermansiaceae bacterium]
MKLLSWNVNGIRAVLKKDFTRDILAEDPDILCLQETKARPEQVEVPLDLGAYRTYWNSAEKPGYSGTAIFTKTEPLEVTCGMGIDAHDTEGRVIRAEFPDFQIVNVYTPNAQDGLRRLDYRMAWDDAFRAYLLHLQKSGKPVIWCGDLNVAHEEIDLARPKQNRGSAGFSDEERAKFSALLEAGFTDTFRHYSPDEAEAYSWWSFRGGARQRNVGWRIDYFGADETALPAVASATIHPAILGSDHCPVGITLK